MKFFRESEPDIFIATGRLQTEADGAEWTREFDAILARDRPFAVIANVTDRPQPQAGKPMVLWVKARKTRLAELVKITIYVAEDSAERAELKSNLPGRSKAVPYPMATAESEAEAIGKARVCLSSKT